MPGTPTGDGFSARKCNRIAAAVIVGTKWHNEECCCHKNAGKEQVAAASHFASSFDPSPLSASAPSEVDGIREVVLNRLILAGLNAVSVCQDASRVDVSDD
jgi:hypothetical protein